MPAFVAETMICFQFLFYFSQLEKLREMVICVKMLKNVQIYDSVLSY